MVEGHPRYRYERVYFKIRMKRNYVCNTAGCGCSICQPPTSWSPCVSRNRRPMRDCGVASWGHGHPSGMWKVGTEEETMSAVQCPGIAGLGAKHDWINVCKGADPKNLYDIIDCLSFTVRQDASRLTQPSHSFTICRLSLSGRVQRWTQSWTKRMRHRKM
jgi:hypothetical protein